MKALDCNINKKKEEEETTENHTKEKKENSTGNADSKHGHPAAEHRTADQSTSEPQL